MVFRVSSVEAYSFLAKYHNGEFPNQRLGQAFYNTYMPSYYTPNDIELNSLNKLFYEIDDEQATQLIFDYYVNYYHKEGE